jgi:hypothetical protein
MISRFNLDTEKALLCQTGKCFLALNDLINACATNLHHYLQQFNLLPRIFDPYSKRL